MNLIYFFIFSIFRSRWVGDIPLQEGLARFDYKLKRKVDLKKTLLCIGDVQEHLV
jgi:hypothetical protein